MSGSNGNGNGKGKVRYYCYYHDGECWRPYNTEGREELWEIEQFHVGAYSQLGACNFVWVSYTGKTIPRLPVKGINFKEECLKKRGIKVHKQITI